ncbi:hypothetical protein LSTR_LSTR012609 [Laodelphax striatellus]|uniref:K Homology domain-containing protein n=1 Tax=Laodelphax striatellus TaxID=195883 RepID=A0A482XN76_LAOST|nr:hypothetical protein LSTR_LSTR012609 [Laodelphax striatellus]
MPPPDADNSSTTIVLRGPQEKLGPALTMVYEKANSVVEQFIEVPYWVHRHLIGRKGADIQRMKEHCPHVYVDFGDKDKERLEDHKIKVRAIKEKLQAKAAELQAQMAWKEIEVPSAYFKYIIGKNGANINRIKDLTDATISTDRGSPNSLRIEGTKAAVAEAEKELKEIIDKLENEIEEEMIIDSRLHSVIIGQKGEQIREIREKFHNQVNITFPSPNEKSDVVRLRGPKAEVDKCCRHLRALVDARYTLDVPVFKQYHKLVIGKGGANIKKIKDDTNTKISLPAEDSKSDVIVISGRKENVEQARDMILKIQEEQDSMIREEVSVDARIHPRLIGARGRAIRQLMNQFQVEVKFAKATDPDPNIVIISGQQDNVANARDHLLELADDYMQDIADYEFEQSFRPNHNSEGTNPFDTLNFNVAAAAGGGGSPNDESRAAASGESPHHNNNGGGERSSSGFVVKGAPWDRRPRTRLALPTSPALEEHPLLLPTLCLGDRVVRGPRDPHGLRDRSAPLGYTTVNFCHCLEKLTDEWRGLSGGNSSGGGRSGGGPRQSPLEAVRKRIRIHAATFHLKVGFRYSNESAAAEPDPALPRCN